MKRTTMNATRSIKWGLAAAATAVVALAAMPGCELLVQFDRGLIDGGGGLDGTLSDSMPQGDAPQTTDAADGPTEAADDGGGSADAPADTTIDGAVDAPVDAGGDGRVVPPPDAPADTRVDAPADAPAADAPAEAAADTGADAPAEVGSDSGADADEGGVDSGGADGDDSG